MMKQVIACCIVVVAHHAAFADDSAESQKERAKATLKLTVDAAKAYSFELQKSRKTEIVLRTEPVLRWSNPILGEVYGNIFLWTAEGKPIVAGSFHKWYTPRTDSTHEFQSLAAEPLKGRGDRGEWLSPKAGVEFKPLPNSQAPATSKSRRLLQMKELARAFAATKTDREGQTSTIRLLSRPIYRYEVDGKGDTFDGALFAFVEGNDPEVWLMLEARKGSETQWHYALARMNSVQLNVTYKDSEVWSVETLPWAVALNPTGPFVLLNRPN